MNINKSEFDYISNTLNPTFPDGLDVEIITKKSLFSVYKNVKTKFSNHYNIKECIKNAHLVIGAVLLPGAKAPNLITKVLPLKRRI